MHLAKRSEYRLVFTRLEISGVCSVPVSKQGAVLSALTFTLAWDAQLPTLAGAFLAIEKRFASESMKERKGRKKLTIIDCFYFVATTISTVGFAFLFPPPSVLIASCRVKRMLSC
jgi:hypothetical protein